MDKRHVEAILFTTKEPVSLEAISKIMNEEKDIILRWMIELQKDYENRGICIRQVAGGFEMVTTLDVYNVVEKVVPIEYEQLLSKASFQTLACVVQHQPINAYQIAKKRGVKNSEHSIQTLIQHNLIEGTELGYITTDRFLVYFGINDLKELTEKIALTPLPDSLLGKNSDEESPGGVS